uniref:Uncharacterized protein n=1 Tax=Chromera velia CCMP2878 TaxID=1169474 RepID=A0A0G4GWX3_9ALVE|eukprot:Cvel_23738.t1-p1 / transcript=Cvel_23738.t1 / gene=Cvel_23738 / organism=Chromera_velia_CCMP2878 / gene_product=hypothetical protein / transcript_product=hypothetical protein / location=Cvel_scaffold2484:652-1802(+) / protein_length=187 / sequence_SO=supercontig / SO=protein_coding / is_pseudo=false
MASENKTTLAKDADYVMPFDGLKLDSLEKFNFGKLGKLDFDFIPGDFTKFGSGTKEKEFSDKDCKGGGSSTITVQPGLGTEEFNNYVLDIEKIDALLTTALIVNGQAVFKYGRERSRMAQFGVQEGGGDFPTFTAPVTLDAASGCIDGKVNLTLLTGWRVGLQATTKCVLEATLSTVVPDLNNFEST